MYHLTIKDPHFLPHLGCDVEFSLEKGKVLTLVGKNGVGKSTLAQRFHQENSFQMILIEQKKLDPFYDRSLSSIHKILAKSNSTSFHDFKEYWKIFGFDRKENRSLSHLSGGECQALKLCLGLMHDKEIYLLDEPTQNLDESFKKSLSTIMRSLIDKDKTVVIIEHDLEWLKGIKSEVAELIIDNQRLVKGKTWST